MCQQALFIHFNLSLHPLIRSIAELKAERDDLRRQIGEGGLK
jgi:hypothetical protein